MIKKILMCLIISILILTIFINSFYCLSSSETSRRSTFFVINESGWIIGVNISFPWLWTAGSIVDIHAVLQAFETGVGVLTIYSFKISTGRIDTSTYVGSFTRVNEEKKIMLKLPTIDPSYLYSNKSPVFINMSVEIRGYVDIDKDKKYFVKNFTVKSIPVSILPSVVKLELSADRYDNFYILTATITNNYPNPLYNSYLAIYINNSMYTSIFYKNIQPFNTTRARIPPIHLEKHGLYIITAVMNYTTSEGFIGYSIASTKIYVKTRPTITLQTNTTITQIYKPVKLCGSIQPSQSVKLFLEMSRDGIEWQKLSKLDVDSDGNFCYVWIANKSGVYLFKARNIETELVREGVSNTIAISVEKIKPSILLEINKSVVEIGKQIKIKIVVEPRVKTRVDIVYIPPDEIMWKNYTTISTHNGFAEVVFTPTKIGEYRFKAVIKEDEAFYSSESSAKIIKVEEIKQIIQSEPESIQQFPQEYRNYVVITIIIIASLFSSILYFKRR